MQLTLLSRPIMLAGLLLLTTFCTGQNSTEKAFTEAVDGIRETWAPDRRVAVFDVDVKKDSREWVVEGTTSVHEAWEELQVLSNRMLPAGHSFNVRLLPDAELGDSVYALVRVSVANLRRSPGHTHELVDQVILGTQLRLMKKRGGWYYAQTPYGYLGWVTGASLSVHDHAGIKEWKRSDLVQTGELVSFIRQEPNPYAKVVNDATLGATVRLLAEGSRFSKVELPDGRSGYIPTSHLADLVKPGVWRAPDMDRVVETAQRLHGIPYLWGGNSTKGFDCSGFTQTVFRVNGYQLPRDASQQVHMGEPVEPEKGFNNLMPGDLIFFGPENRITHVALSLGGPRYIHASAYVEINSLQEGDPDYSEDRRQTVRYIKRITDARASNAGL